MDPLNSLFPYPLVSGREIPDLSLADSCEGGSVYPGGGADPGMDTAPNNAPIPQFSIFPESPGIPEPLPGFSRPDSIMNETMEPDQAPQMEPLPSLPLPDPGENIPAFPGIGHPSYQDTNASPLPAAPRQEPGMGTPDAPGPSPFAHVRFLNAVCDGAPLRLTLGHRLLATYLRPGHLTGYFKIPVGFRTLTLYDARYPHAPLFCSSLPFNPGEQITLAVVRSGGGVDLVRVDDSPACSSGWSDRGCLRLVNLAYNSPGLDLILTDGRVVFTDVRFKEVTTYRRARPGQYDLYIAQTPYTLPEQYTDIETVEELPMLWQEASFPNRGISEPLASFYLEARSGVCSTIYLMGNWNRSHYLRVLITDNDT